MPTALAQQSTNQPVELAPSVITGTRLTGAEAEGSVSVTPIDIAKPVNSGFTSVADVLQRKLPQLGGTGVLNEGFGNGGNGGAYVSLRGLPGNATLVLVDGRRTSTSDLNLIPEAAIDTVEVLNDGAGAIYGSDAVAGVVNVRLKKSFNGVRVYTYYGNTFESDISVRKFQALWGTSTENTTALFSAEYSAANDQFSTDRDRSFPSGSNVSQTSNPGLLFNKTNFGTHEVVTGGVTNRIANGIALRWTIDHANTSGLTSAAQVPTLTGPPPATINGFPLVYTAAGNKFDPFAYLDTSTATSSGQLVPARNAAEAALRALLPAGATLRYGGNQSLAPGVDPGFPFGFYTIAYRPHERYGVNSSIAHKIFGNNLEAFADAYYMRNSSTYQLAPSPLGGLTMSSGNYWFQTVFPGSPANTPVNFTYRP
ncbi:MAG: TonB-dependent receptor plug domain-containing protein, partial [Verrucomicrobiota bacterium]